MALSKSALKAKFVTGAIPTQTDFANLIDGMLSMPLGGNPRGAVSRGRQGRQAGDRQQRLFAQHRRGQEGRLPRFVLQRD